MSNKQEYLADTNPNDPNSDLEITFFTTTPGGTYASMWSGTKIKSLSPRWAICFSGCSYIEPKSNPVRSQRGEILASPVPRRKKP